MAIKHFSHGYAIESWSDSRTRQVISWLKETYGPEDQNGAWFVDQDFDLFTLYMTNEVRFLAMLKFPFLQ